MNIMNSENINVIISAIKILQHNGVNISDNLNPEKILSDFESLEQRKLENRYTLPSDYKFMKFIQQAMLQSLAAVTDNLVKLFVPLSNAIDKIKLELSHEYEQTKIVNFRIRQLKEHGESEGGVNVIMAKQNPW